MRLTHIKYGDCYYSLHVAEEVNVVSPNKRPSTTQRPFGNGPADSYASIMISQEDILSLQFSEHFLRGLSLASIPSSVNKAVQQPHSSHDAADVDGLAHSVPAHADVVKEANAEVRLRVGTISQWPLGIFPDVPGWLSNALHLNNFSYKFLMMQVRLVKRHRLSCRAHFH